MKYAVFPVFLLLNVYSTSAQAIKGKITNVPDGKLYITYSYDHLYRQTDTLQLKPDGSFEKRLHFKGIGNVYLTTSTAHLTLSVFPNSSLIITANAETREKFRKTLTIRGPGSEICTALFVLDDKRLKDIKWDYNLPADSFVIRLTYWRDMANAITRKLVKERSVKPGLTPDEVKLFLKTDSLNNLYWTIGAFRDYHSQRLDKTSEEDPFFQKNIAPYVTPTDDPDYMAADQYRYFWDRYVIYHYEWRKKGKDSILLKDKNWMAGRLEEICARLKGKLQQAVMAGVLLSEFPYCYEFNAEKDFPLYDSVLLVYGKQIDNPSVLQQTIRLSNIKKERRALTAKGKDVPDFILTDSSGKKYRLKDFAGRIIYLDVWASWCGPCIAEIPDYKKLVEKLGERNDVVFLSASIDDTKEDWIEKGLRKHTPPGLQLWAGKGGWNSVFAKTYFISGVPQYILIDGQGKIINFNAPRPSSGTEIETALNDALKN